MERTVSKQTTSFPDLWRLVLLTGLAIILLVLAIWMTVAELPLFSSQNRVGDPLGVSQTAFVEETGIRVVRVNIAGGGGFIRLHYQVVDPDKAVIIHEDEYPPGFIVESTGQVLNIPWHEHSHDRDLHAGITYSELIKNNGGALQQGDKISVVIGKSQLDGVVVQ